MQASESLIILLHLNYIKYFWGNPTLNNAKNYIKNNELSIQRAARGVALTIYNQLFIKPKNPPI